MTYLEKLSKRLELTASDALELSDDEFNPLELIKMDSRFRQASTMLVQTVKHYDNSYPEIGADEILAAILNEAMEHLFPNIHVDKSR